MQYRKFGNLGFEVSALGLGAMRFLNKEGTEEVDVERAVKLIHKAVDMGVNYIDTAYVYLNERSEGIVGEALKGLDRSKLKIATKLPMWGESNPDKWEEMLNTSLKRLGVDYIDFYLAHALNRKTFEANREKLLPFLDEMVKKGKIQYPSFSFHDDYEAYIEIIDAYDWKMSQVQFNVLDVYKQATLEGIRHAGKKGVPIVIMEPLRGGALVNNIPLNVQKVYDEYPVKLSPAEWAFRFVADLPEVATILSGIFSDEILEDSVRIFSEAKVGILTQEDKNMLTRVREEYEARVKIGCTACRYCVPCPQNVSIPDIFQSYNNASMFDKEPEYGDQYKRRFVNAEKPAHGGLCVECGVCENACPQSIPIISKLAEIQKHFG